MKRIFNNIFRTNFDFRYISKNKLNNIIFDLGWQIVEIQTFDEWKQKHIIYATSIDFNDFFDLYKSLINKNKKILILGDKHKISGIYHFLLSKHYKVYMLK